jgi:hypothetical protein
MAGNFYSRGAEPNPFELEIGAGLHEVMIVPSKNRCQELRIRRTGYQLSSAFATEQILSPVSRLMCRTPWVARAFLLRTGRQLFDRAQHKCRIGLHILS